MLYGHCCAQPQTQFPNDKFFQLTRRLMFGTIALSWISELEPVYVRKYVRDKYDPKVGEMDLLHANQNHAVVRCPESREVTVSARDVAPTAPTPNNGDLRDRFSSLVQVQPALVGDRRATTSAGPETCNKLETELQTPLNSVQLAKEKLPIGLLVIVIIFLNFDVCRIL